MKQITEDYVSFEIAKLLEEKGFDGKCNYYYRYHDKALIKYFPNPGIDDNRFYCTKTWIKKHANRNHVEYILAPTHQMAMAWLREEHLYHIFAKPYWPQGDMRNKMSWQGFIVDLNTINGDSQCYADSYEEAVEAALLYVLKNLI